ncbi:MAG: glycerol-3-phosphate dehydrogenase subunit GlpB [Deltaproteobacteria bacterium]|nr:glycerol-3-phosphate dehydrogenase subunit GlpB [Deltaproteobacteria bacterium]
MTTNPIIECELAVIGKGMAGMASALFAANRGISTVQIGVTGGIIFASGLLDLLSIHPVEENRSWKDPWAGIAATVRDIPNHPYARIKRNAMEAAFEEVIQFLDRMGLPYTGRNGHNLELMMPLGTTKETYCVPASMAAGIRALKEKDACLLLDFHGLGDFSATLIRESFGRRWPALRSARVPFPGHDPLKELYTGEIMAQAMELAGNREKLAQTVKPLLGDARFVGMPAVLGLEKSGKVMADLKERIGVPLFEMPTLPVSVPGLRLNHAFAHGLRTKGVKRMAQSRVSRVETEPERGFVLGVANHGMQQKVHAQGVILASGRFWGRGLAADRHRIRETLFNLPVTQPPHRSEWHRKDFLARGGHPVNRSGLEIDPLFRPLNAAGEPAFERLFAAGSILAHQDWMRMKCGSGIAISTAYAAVDAFSRMRG